MRTNFVEYESCDDRGVNDEPRTDGLWSEVRRGWMRNHEIRRYREIAGVGPDEALIWWEHWVFPAEAKAAIENGWSPEEARVAVQLRLRERGQELSNLQRQAEAASRLEEERREQERREEERQERLERERERQAQLEVPEIRARREHLQHLLLAQVAEPDSMMESISVSDRITVTAWAGAGSPPDTAEYVCLSDGTWQSVTEPAGPPKRLSDILSVPISGALHVRTLGASPTPSALAASLPRSAHYLEPTDEFDTGDAVLDGYITGMVQVAINGQRWAPFESGSSGPDEIVWLPCDQEMLELEQAAPAGVLIASASGIEWGSRTSGTFCWSLIDTGMGYVCFIAEPDEDANVYLVESGRGKTYSDFAHQFIGWIDWPPVSAAVARALELGGEFHGRESELYDGGSESCEVSAAFHLPGV